MRIGFGLMLCVAAVGAFVGSGSAGAQSLEFLHEHRQEGARICMKDHFHYGNSSGHATRQAAEKAAIANWSGFTAWEYGDRWGSWRLAGSRKVTCSGEPGSIGCQIEGRPCRPMTGGGQRPKRPAASAQ